jgi:hypothetical protein
MIFYTYTFSDYEELIISSYDDLKIIFKNFLDEKNGINLKGFRNYFFSLIKTKGNVCKLIKV